MSKTTSLYGQKCCFTRPLLWSRLERFSYLICYHEVFGNSFPFVCVGLLWHLPGVIPMWLSDCSHLHWLLPLLVPCLVSWTALVFKCFQLFKKVHYHGYFFTEVCKTTDNTQNVFSKFYLFSVLVFLQYLNSYGFIFPMVYKIKLIYVTLTNLIEQN